MRVHECISQAARWILTTDYLIDKNKTATNGEYGAGQFGHVRTYSFDMYCDNKLLSVLCTLRRQGAPG